MRILVCGGRAFLNKQLLDKTLDDIHRETPITDLIHGNALGADTLGSFWAMNNLTVDGRYIRTWTFPADWNKDGKAAGPIRNKQMLEEGKPDLVIAFPGGKGTANMVKLAREAGVEVREIR